MKIGIDGTPLTIPFPCGTKNYAKQLICSLAEIDKKNKYVVFAARNIDFPKPNNFLFIRLPDYLPVFKRQLFLALLAKKQSVDIFHYLEPYGSIFLEHQKIITTVHDTNLNYTYPWLSKYFHKRLYCELTRKIVLNKTNSCISVSSFVKRELVDKKMSQKIYIVHNGVDSKFKKSTRSKQAMSYFLGMGDFTPRKNVFNLIKAFSIFIKNNNKDYRLIIITTSDRAERSFDQKAREFNVQPYTTVMKQVSDSQLIKLYSEALAFIYPSLYEGFGLPILEAMACSCPVITSNCGALKETAGNAAILVNPKSAMSIANAMKKIGDPKLLKAKVNEGLKRSRKFSWHKTAEKTLKVYEETYKNNGKK